MASHVDAPAPAYLGDDKPVPYNEKNAVYDNERSAGSDEYDVQNGSGHVLKKDLKSRHMQMIAIGGAIGAGYFVGSGSALAAGGPGSLVISFAIVGTMLMCVMQCLAELAVMYPVNGAFFQYAMRFIDPAVGFATGWDYAISWLVVLPFEITSAGIVLSYWPKAAEQNIGVWITVFLVALSAVQIFGVRGYGEVEFVLSIIKVIACIGFILLGIIIDCGGVPTDTRGYIGAHYWHNPGAFANGFKGFCANFANAAFSYAGTELVGLAAAEAANPLRSLPQAARQVFFRITFFYVIGLFIVGLIVPYTNENLLQGDTPGAQSPFVIAIGLANIKGLPSVMNAVIVISVLSVANSATFGSTRTIQALAEFGMAPKFFSYIDKNGRPLWCIALQLAFGLLAFINEAGSGHVIFSWLLALSGLIQFFVWGAICLSHIRFRAAWKYHGHSTDTIPYKSPYGVWGSWYGFLMNVICIIAVFYSSLFDAQHDAPSAKAFFNEFLAGPIVLFFYLFWKIWSREWRLLIPLAEIDVTSGLNASLEELQEQAKMIEGEKTWKNLPMRIARSLF